MEQEQQFLAVNFLPFLRMSALKKCFYPLGNLLEKWKGVSGPQEVLPLEKDRLIIIDKDNQFQKKYNALNNFTNSKLTSSFFLGGHKISIY